MDQDLKSGEMCRMQLTEFKVRANCQIRMEHYNSRGEIILALPLTHVVLAI